MTCLILAAGRGTRLAKHSDSKPLTPLLGVPLIERVMLTAHRTGVTDFFVVTGYNGEKVRRFLDHFALREDIRITHVKNDEWKKESGVSVFKAKPFIRENFILLMCDHLFDASILARIQKENLAPGELILAVDRNIRDCRNTDPDDVKRVQVIDGKIVNIGKNISSYNAFDTGIFFCTTAIFEALEKNINKGEYSFDAAVLTMADRKKARAFDIGDSWWIDVDDERALRKAEQLLIHPA